MEDMGRVKSFKSMRAKQRASILLDILKYNSMMKRLFTKYLDDYYLKIKLPVN